MRERFRSGVADILLCVIVVGLEAELWIIREAGSTRSAAELVVLSAVCAIALVVMLVARAATRRARMAEAQAARTMAEMREAATAALADDIRARHRDVEKELNAVIVEIVAAQQAVVRAAHTDDVLTRIRAAEDNAHEAVAIVRRASIELASAVREVGHRDARVSLPAHAPTLADRQDVLVNS